MIKNLRYKNILFIFALSMAAWGCSDDPGTADLLGQTGQSINRSTVGEFSTVGETSGDEAAQAPLAINCDHLNDNTLDLTDLQYEKASHFCLNNQQEQTASEE